MKLSLERLILARTPRSKGLLHIGVREKRVAQNAQDWTVHATGHVRAPGHLLCRNMNLQAMPVGIGDGRAKHDTVKPRPKRVGHAHRARLAGGVHRVPSQGRALQLLARKANGAGLGVGNRIDLAHALFVPCHQTSVDFCPEPHAAIYHMIWAHAARLASNFYMERIRRLDENRGMLFFETVACSSVCELYFYAERARVAGA